MLEALLLTEPHTVFAEEPDPRRILHALRCHTTLR